MGIIKCAVKQMVYSLGARIAVEDIDEVRCSSVEIVARQKSREMILVSMIELLNKVVSNVCLWMAVR